MITRKKVRNRTIIVDLDGTLFDVNTFHQWIFFNLFISIRINPLDTLVLVKFIILRLLKRITHEKMKYEILKITEEKKYIKYIDKYIQRIEKYLNYNVLQIIDSYDMKILATAAPEIYVSYLAKKHKFDYFIATPKTNKKYWFENIKERKLESFKELASEQNLPNEFDLVTDHYDDLPLMKYVSNTILVNPSKKTLESVIDKNINYSIL